MKIINLYAELLANPRNIVAYRDLTQHYQKLAMDNEFKAMQELIQRKFNGSSSNIDQKQLQND